VKGLMCACPTVEAYLAAGNIGQPLDLILLEFAEKRDFAKEGE
jgi:hypothetical protein